MTTCQTVVMTTPDDHYVSDAPGQKGASQGATAVFTMREAADVAGVSVSTLRRRRADLVSAGAVIEASGWQVPITALIAAGLVPGEGNYPPRIQGPAVAPEAPSVHLAPEQEVAVQQLQNQVHELTEQVAEWRRRAEVAEARAEERGRSLESLRMANETERMALRMLTGRSTQPPSDAPPATATPEHPVASEPAPRSEPSTSPPAAEGRGGFLRRLFTG